MHESPVDNDIFGSSIYYRLFLEAETVRWRMGDIPWSSIDTRSVPRAWIALAREIAYTELTPFNATAQYLQDYASEIDFTQWATVWLYEEMKHPQAMIRWLHEFGETVDSRFVMEGRKVEIIPSLMATLVTNVYAEVLAWSMYMLISKRSPEPVLAQVTSLLAGDEARHASGFYSYAKKLLAKSDNPDRERLTALKVMYFWAETNHRVEHPVNLFLRRMADRPEVLDVIPLADFQACAKKMYARVYPLLGNLLGLRINNVDDVYQHLKALR
ncbi:hypothetical protein WL21_17105 [Burkholderia ubonensis]|uniref:ferritin-like domain-containing protein n=1 Tax=Burkholderia ubonensis TaxID=101571 RepID=UPI00075A2C28|nr:ferritin-like domain-containing protein [Burkholderia ubonensis]KVO89004.1 hypothetical protein WJ81_14150 [Burkholderia ubonensis]KVZ64084.1 hypothetical protein WL20_13405 [Burkholderia ubonensis]KVZ67042.1 hypothetical protein WL21_17105 [Burkholderia ubonensis]